MAALTVPSDSAVQIPAGWNDLKVTTGDVVIEWDNPNLTTATGLPLANGQTYSRPYDYMAGRRLYARASTGTAEIRWI